MIVWELPGTPGAFSHRLAWASRRSGEHVKQVQEHLFFYFQTLALTLYCSLQTLSSIFPLAVCRASVESRLGMGAGWELEIYDVGKCLPSTDKVQVPFSQSVVVFFLLTSRAAYLNNRRLSGETRIQCKRTCLGFGEKPPSAQLVKGCQRRAISMAGIWPGSCT